MIRVSFQPGKDDEPFSFGAQHDETWAALTVRKGFDHVCFYFENLEQIAAFGRAIEREAEICMAESQAEEVA